MKVAMNTPESSLIHDHRLDRLQRVATTAVRGALHDDIARFEEAVFERADRVSLVLAECAARFFEPLPSGRVLKDPALRRRSVRPS